MGDVSGTDGYVTKAQFEDMINRVLEYVLKTGTIPSVVFIEPGKENYITFKTCSDMFDRWTTYKTKNGILPSIVYFKKQVPVRKVGPIQGKLEVFLGEFNSFTEYYNKIKGRGYGYYYNDVKTRDQAIEALWQKTGLNCTDITQISVDLAKEMGYQTRYVKVQCTSGGHIRMQIFGKEFTSWTRVDPAAALSVGSQFDIGTVWCDNTTAKVVNEKWLEIDDGIT